MKIRCVLFDLDGTLVDTAPEIADAVNDTLRRLKRPPVPEALVRSWIGEGSRVLLSRALAHAGLPEAQLKQVWGDFQHDYLERCGTRSQVYPRVPETLKRLAMMGVPMALLTNKESAFAHRVLVRHGLSEFFDLMVTGDTLPVRKPDPAVVRHALSALGVDAETALLVGDSATDIRTARAAGVAVWAVGYGYASEPLQGDLAPDRLVKRFDEIIEFAGEFADERVSIA
jgi:phosphoglycolate phosphatase